ncbi:MAG: rhomboid family intramembrane serine protease [Nanoarchaeota archaeon]|nr:rhomboid family intramembrane serine protease [Nanoarchaeota archaeon]
MKVKFYALWLSFIMIIIFFLQNIIPGLTETFLLDSSKTLSEPWRIVTSIFLHSSITHLLFNLFALILFGLILEKEIKSNNFLIVFFVSGIIASIFSVFFYDAALGASGAIFGVIGALTIMRPTIAVFAFGIPMPLFIASILWVGADVIGYFNPTNIANLAHLSGIGIGFIMGIFYRVNSPKKKSYVHKIEIPEHQLRKWEVLYLKN